MYINGIDIRSFESIFSNGVTIRSDIIYFDPSYFVAERIPWLISFAFKIWDAVVICEYV